MIETLEQVAARHATEMKIAADRLALVAQLPGTPTYVSAPSRGERTGENISYKVATLAEAFDLAAEFKALDEVAIFTSGCTYVRPAKYLNKREQDTFDRAIGHRTLVDECIEISIELHRYENKSRYDGHVTNHLKLFWDGRHITIDIAGVGPRHDNPRPINLAITWDGANSSKIRHVGHPEGALHASHQCNWDAGGTGYRRSYYFEGLERARTALESYGSVHTPA